MSEESESDPKLKEEDDTREETSGAKAQHQSHEMVLKCDWRASLRKCLGYTGKFTGGLECQAKDPEQSCGKW